MANEELKIENVSHAIQTAFALYLEYGIEKVTKVMIAEKSGLSVKSLDRYFVDKTDLVIRTAEWFMGTIKERLSPQYPDSLFNSSEFTGAQLMERYMQDMKSLFFQNPRIFALYSDYKMYIYYHCEENEQANLLLCNWMGNRRIRQKIYQLGKEDGSFSEDIDPLAEEQYFCESFFGFLANLAWSFKLHPQEEIDRQIDHRIGLTLAAYAGGGNAHAGTTEVCLNRPYDVPQTQASHAV